MKNVLFASFVFVVLCLAPLASAAPDIALPGIGVDPIFGFLVFDQENSREIETRSACEYADCWDDYDCIESCGCSSATCNSNYTCDDNCSGSGSGSNRPRICYADCYDDYDCAYACPGYTTWSCNGAGLCQED